MSELKFFHDGKEIVVDQLNDYSQQRMPFRSWLRPFNKYPGGFRKLRVIYENADLFYMMHCV